MENKHRHFIYMLKCGDNTIYTGYTNDLEKRLAMHESGKGAKYTRGRGPLELVYLEEFPDKVSAMRQEYQIKKLTRAKKEQIIEAFKERKNPNEGAEQFSGRDR